MTLIKQKEHQNTSSHNQIAHRLFLYSLYLPLQYFQDEVDRQGIYYNRKSFGRLQRYLSTYQIPSYRALHREEAQNLEETNITGSTVTGSTENPTNTFIVQKYPPQLKWAQIFLHVYSLRCALALVGQKYHVSKEVKVWLGDELTGADGFELETTFLLWGIVCVLFLHFTLSSDLLDYKFMALYSMTETSKSRSTLKTSGSPIHFSSFGLSSTSFQKFRQFRAGAFAYFHLIHCTLTPTSFSCVITLTWIADLYTTHPFPSYLFTAFHLYYMYLIIAIIYYALIAFIVITYYVHVKQKQLTVQLLSLTGKFTSSNSFDAHLLIHQLLSITKSLNLLSEEISDYNHFWASYLSIVFLLYVLLIVFISFVCLFAQMAFIVNIGYWLVLIFHIASVGAIIFFAGAVVVKNKLASLALLSLVGRISKNPINCSKNPQRTLGGSMHHLKLHHLAQNLQTVEDSGFILLNGYLVSHDTFRLLGVNIVVYFILILGNYASSSASVSVSALE